MSFGPPSDEISIGNFAQLGSSTLARLSQDVGEVWLDLAGEEQQKISEELRYFTYFCKYYPLNLAIKVFKICMRNRKEY
jgi:hypothetical protein